MAGVSASMGGPSLPPVEVIPYSIAGSSEHSGHYAADNIKVDRPHDQSSRWSGAQQPPSMKQWILLRLDTLAVHVDLPESITFGKFHRKHPCNMKEFKVYVGLHPEHMIQVLHTGLKDDVIPETFAIPQSNKAGVPFPTRFIKILPFSAHGQSFHISIWYDEYRETAVLRHILKHLRERRLLTPYASILSRTHIELEHPLVTALHKTLVLQGDFPSAESLLPQLCSAGLFDDYVRSCQPHARWMRLHVADADGDAPGPRGGHAMALDGSRGIVYLLAGWDGRRSLDDMWAYDIGTERWEVLCRSTASEKNGPGPRSCHKMSSGGPSLIFDHQMVMDSDAQMIYISGGRVVTGDWGSPKYSGLYSYNVRTSKWKLLQPTSASGASSTQTPISPRYGHSMVLDPLTRTLFIFAGQRDDRYLSDMYAYDLESNSVTELFANFSATGALTLLTGDAPNWVYRYTHPNIPGTWTQILPEPVRETSDATVPLGPSPDFHLGGEAARRHQGSDTDRGDHVPRPRYAHQVVYDEKTTRVFLHGGNAGEAREEGGRGSTGDDDGEGDGDRYQPRSSMGGARGRGDAAPGEDTHSSSQLPQWAAYSGGGDGERDRDGDRNRDSDHSGEDESRTRTRELRLDDFWSMTLVRFREMCEDQPALAALHYLQTEVGDVVDHANVEEADVFRSLLAHLLAIGPIKLSPASGSASHERKPRAGETVGLEDVGNNVESPSALPIHMQVVHPDFEWDRERGREELVEDEPGTGVPPKKRSRSTSPEDEEVWTSAIEGEGDSATDDTGIDASIGEYGVGISPDLPVPLWAGSTSKSTTRSARSTLGSAPATVTRSGAQKRSHAVLMLDEDPLEVSSSGDDGTNMKARGKPPPADRFRQRTEVFEGLLAFVEATAKQPHGSLLDLVDAEDGL
ncbi:hypothetical protein ID866_1397 [Astraeus odoratus]|nr:hypothetical protein ID866_1397 [Astraeus odoratus]